MSFRSGFISIIGRPNVGKSTLLNAVIGEKITIVSAKAQTTRNRIRGVKHLPHAQIIFVDTPGIHRRSGTLNVFMVREALSAMTDVDGVIFMVDASAPVTDDDAFILGRLKKAGPPVVLVPNKIDRVEKPALLPLIERYGALFPFREVVPVSALKGDGVEELVEVLVELLPEGPRYFPEDMTTDQPERFLAAEIVREKVFAFTHQEVPYSVAVVTESFSEDPERGLISIEAVINVERDSQKGIIIGRKGEMLKRIGTAARRELEGLLGAKVFLRLFVRVTKDWTRNVRALREFGYE
ncbi:MAG TPA: GTPase Era [Deltaproteobacteria bacterium]|nr:GTPase Era [Deltaproteobacteria bacterium]